MPLGCTAGGIGGARRITGGTVNALRSPATECSWRISAAPDAPPSTPSAISPRLVSHNRLLGSTIWGGAGAVAARRDCHRVITRNTPTAQQAPVIVGIASAGRGPGLDNTAAPPAT